MASSDCSAVPHDHRLEQHGAAGRAHAQSGQSGLQYLPYRAADAATPTLASVAVLHTGISGNCGQCHGGTTTALTWFNNFTPKDAILTPSHIPYLSGTDCSSCHAANYVDAAASDR